MNGDGRGRNFAIGDIQGCTKTFKKLLKRLDFSPKNDTLWLLGDLINRGPDNVGILRFVLDHQDSVRVVLGNHDLHFLATHFGLRELKAQDTLNDVLNDPVRKSAVEFLLRQPFIREHREQMLVHAGLYPSWKYTQIKDRAKELSLALQHNPKRALEAIQNKVLSPSEATRNYASELSFSAAVFTRIRVVDHHGNLVPYSAERENIPQHSIAWYEHHHPSWPKRVIFGHWAAHGHVVERGIVSLDGGCVWGGDLVAYDLDHGLSYLMPNAELKNTPS